MKEKIMEYVSEKEKPDFFKDPEDTLTLIHGEIRKAISTATATLTVELDMELAMKAEKYLTGFGWTLEETLILYLYWCISNPARTEQWFRSQHPDRSD